MTPSPSSAEASRGRTLPRLAPVVPAAILCAFLLPQTDARRAAAQPKAAPAQPAGGDWPMAAKNHANTRYSELDQITTENAKNLKLAWKFDTGVYRGQEAAPVVVNNTMYVVTPWPNVLYAFDLTKPGPAVKWKYESKPAAFAKGIACCDYVNRGAVYADGRAFITALDGHVCGVDAASGKELWKAKVGDITKGETVTMSPLVVKGKVLVGNSGGEFGVRGWLKALDAASGTVAWTAYSTGPDADVKIGPKFKPFYPQDRGKDLGVATWPPSHWKIGGGTVWGWLSYDPELNLVYHGTGNPSPWNAEQRPGDNKWTCGVFARDPETGDAHWYYQYTPHDTFGHDGANEHVLADLTLGGQPRKVLLHPDRNGHVYVLDRATGAVLSADPFVRVTAYKGVDLDPASPTFGKLRTNPDKTPKPGRVAKDVSPAHSGAKDWQPSSFSPRTGYLYVPHQTLAMDWEGVEVSYIAGTPFVGANAKVYADPVEPGDGSRGALTAWNPVARKVAWRIKEKFPVWSGTAVTAGDVVFYGTMDRWFKAVNARTGDELWKAELDSGIVGQPTTFRGPDGKQYVAVISGVGGWAGLVVSGGLDRRDISGANGWVNAMKDLPEHTAKGGTLYVFALP